MKGGVIAVPINIKGRSLVSMLEFSSVEIDYLINSAIELKRLKNQRVFPKNLSNRNIALIFDRPSCRTRTSFVVAASDEGAHLEIFPYEDIRFGIKESVKDIARVFGRMFDGIAYRGDHSTLLELVEYAGIPVWNSLTESYHPTQVLADLMTIKERFGQLKGIKLAYVGDGRNNVVNSLIIGCLKMGVDLKIVTPSELAPSLELLKSIKEDCADELLGSVVVIDNIEEGVRDCHIIYGDVWISMGEEHLIEERIALLSKYKVTQELMSLTDNDETIYLHCLPALHDQNTIISQNHPDIMEVSEDVFESPRSFVFDQAENRMHTIKALMNATI
jgi:ornithine carbamoyltransferase